MLCAQYLETHLPVYMVTKHRVILSWNPGLSKIISRNPRPSFVAFSRTDLKTTVKESGTLPLSSDAHFVWPEIKK